MAAELSLILVENSSDPAKEIAKIRVVKGGSTKGYALVDKTFDENGNPSNHFRHIYLLPDIQVADKEFIWVYTGVGKNTTRGNDTNTTTHLLYWNSKDPVWNDKEGDNAILIKYGVVTRVKVAPVKK